VETPETRYARTPDGVHIGYQVAGSGPIDLVYVPGWISNIEAQWEAPGLAPFLRRLASIARLILFDRRGTGISDHPPDEESLALEYGAEDLRTVLEAAGSERAMLFGFEDGGLIAAMFAASNPERTLGLVMFAAFARYRWSADYPWGVTDEALDEWNRHVAEEWGTDAFWRYNLGSVAPSMKDDHAFVRAWARFSRQCASPGGLRAIDRTLQEVDARAVLPTIRVPTLIMNRDGDLDVDPEQARWIATQIPGARLAIFPGSDHPPFVGDVDAVFAELERFIGALREDEAVFDRALATVLFTDIVDSTPRALELGDRAWRELLERHNATIRALLVRYRGREVSTAGDGFFATFDGPARAIRCASEIADAVKVLGLEVRAGVHTGEVEIAGDDLRGIAVHIGARVGSLAGPSEVLVSQTVRDLVAGSGLAFEDAGEHELKGVPDRWRLYRVA
jgi:class 3 adenylate cyclase/pimeloyl-ACP methyl ester carboxylesterase